MIPDVPTVLAGITRSVMIDIAPEVQDPYRAQTLQLLSALLMMIVPEFERAAQRLVEENDVLADLFDAAQAVVADDALSASLREAATAPHPSLMVTALRERNRVLRGLLTQLHAHVETLSDPAARLLEDRIWAELAASTQRRHLDLANG